MRRPGPAQGEKTWGVREGGDQTWGVLRPRQGRSPEIVGSVA